MKMIVPKGITGEKRERERPCMSGVSQQILNEMKTVTGRNI
jgi:hypothetical protein